MEVVDNVIISGPHAQERLETEESRVQPESCNKGVGNLSCCGSDIS